MRIHRHTELTNKVLSLNIYHYGFNFADFGAPFSVCFLLGVYLLKLSYMHDSSSREIYMCCVPRFFFCQPKST
jgi:hypothetical protein